MKEGRQYKLIAVGTADAKIEFFVIDQAPMGFQKELLAKVEEIEAQTKQKEEQYKKKKRNEAALLSAAVNILADNESKAAYQQSYNNYYKVCQIVRSALKIKVAEPKQLDGNPLQPYALMKAYFQKMNMRYRSVKLDKDWWKYTDGMLIAFNGNKQPVALLQKGRGCYELVDPQLGISVPVDEKTADGLFKDAFMIYRPLPDKEMSGRDLIGFGLERIDKKDILLFALSLLGIGLLGMAAPLLIGLTIDWIIPMGNIHLLSQAGILLAVVAITSFLFNLARGFTMLRVEGQLDVDMQTAVWDRLLNLPLSFFKQFTSAELASRALGITMIRDIISGPVMALLLTGIYSLFSWLVLFYYNVSLAVVASLMLGICISVNYFIAKKEIVYESQINQLTNKLAGLSFQLIKGAVKIQQSGAIERAYYRWAKEQAEKHRAMQNKGRVISWMETFNGLFLPASLGMIYYLVTMQPGFSLLVGQYIGFNAAYMMFVSAVFSIFSSMHVLFQVLPLYDRGKIILQTIPEMKEDKRILDKPTGKIEVDHLQFRYAQDGSEILKDISLEIQPGEYVGIVGISGSGKSTLLRLLLGFEVIYKGKITYDDQDITSLDLRDLRKKIGVVLQTGKLMTGSIYHNIVGSNLHLTVEEAWKAARVAGIDEDIKAMPMGMHTVIMEGAGTISGGQKQRILIARAVVNKPKILFFDEATSALDNITQAKIKESLDHFAATRIVIAHRLSTVKNCDRIIVLDQGIIKEAGDYETLMERKGVFYKLAQRQLA
ncbi:NHLP bacteriocin export ABC transporter permease/ATPase subunit [Geosporobacter ferrireducens]|uniref:NHLP bacteriocin export ABC transporter permease/ATPase subunit n=1 Tax=Geosporobacter ferrireducens TaxID=1424294 RepID=UPI001470AC2D|nr:NHLP bacteriocin export ABC transporter permease/ATPase subunit [Geosporobacter ferrireducens]